MAKGLFRDDVFVQVDYDGRASYPIVRGDYDLEGHKPLFDELPTREEFFEARHVQRFGGRRSDAGFGAALTARRA